MAKHGKKYLAAAAKVDQERLYSPDEAIALVKETSFVKFDPTVEVHLVFAQGEAIQASLDAGADFAGSDDIIARIDKENFFDFDVAIATPDMMGKVGRIGRKLGPRGLMPNPKSGTIVPAEELPRTIREVRGGRVEFRNDKTGILHVAIGKLSFTPEQIQENFVALMEAVKASKPSGAKGTYIRSVTLTSTMGPGVPVNPSQAQGGA
jgi:large subunit ribosomal protein L1